MTTERQIAANRENAKKSTGPRTSGGKFRSRRNALKHGLAAETIIDVLENRAAYRALARTINADFRPATNLERELMARLVSLLWRLRRTTAIESGLLTMQPGISPKPLDVFYRVLETVPPPAASRSVPNGEIGADFSRIAGSFLTLATDCGAAFERLGRYEARLWRQVVQTIVLLNGLNRGFNVAADGRYPRPKTRMPEAINWPPIKASNFLREG